MIESNMIADVKPKMRLKVTAPRVEGEDQSRSESTITSKITITKKAKGERKRARRGRRRKIKLMLAAGRTVVQIARILRCPEQTVRQHVRAIRDEARRRAAEEYGPAAAETGDLVEAVEAALQKVRSAQTEADPAKGTHRGLLALEIRTLHGMMDVRRDLATQRANADGAEPDALEDLSDEELLVKARELGIDTTPYERQLNVSSLTSNVYSPPEAVQSLRSEVQSPAEAVQGPELKVPSSEAEPPAEAGDSPGATVESLKLEVEGSGAEAGTAAVGGLESKAGGASAR